MLRLALYEPDIAPNTGTILRLAACLGLGVDIIEPCGFPVDDARLRRAGMDYIDHVSLIRHADWHTFQASRKAPGSTPNRLLLLTTHGATPYTEFTYNHGDILLLGRESAGVPEHVHQCADARLAIPVQAGLRSLNVAIAAAMVAGEAVRQLKICQPI